MTLRYKFFLDGREVGLAYGNDFTLTYSFEESTQVFRKSIDTKFTATGEVFKKFIALDWDERHYLRIDRKVEDGDYKVLCNTEIKFSSSEIDYGSKKVTFSVDVVDDYKTLMDNYDKKFRLIDLKASYLRTTYKRPAILQFATFTQDRVVTTLSKGIVWEQAANMGIDFQNYTKYKLFRNNPVITFVMKAQGSTSKDSDGVYVGYEFGNLYRIYNDGSGQDKDKKPYVEMSHTVGSQNRNKFMVYFHLDAGAGQVCTGEYACVPSGSQNSINFTGSRQYDCQVFRFDYATRMLMSGSYYFDKDFKIQDISDSIVGEDFCSIPVGYKYAIPFIGDNVKVEIIISLRSSTKESIWGVDKNGNYFLPPEDSVEYLPILHGSWEYFSLWVKADWDLFHSHEGFMANTVIFQDGYYVPSIIKNILKEIGVNITHNENTNDSVFLYSDTNPVLPNFNSKINLLLTPKSNLMHGTKYEAAHNAQISLKDVMDILRGLFNCYWIVTADKRLKIEHIQYFLNGGSYNKYQGNIIDLKKYMSSAGRHWGFNETIVSVNQAQVSESVKMTFMEETTDYFDKCQILCKSAFLKKNSFKEIRVENVTTNLDWTYLRPDQTSQEGYVAILAGNLIRYPGVRADNYKYNAGALVSDSSYQAVFQTRIIGDNSYCWADKNMNQLNDLTYDYEFYTETGVYISNSRVTGAKGTFKAPTGAYWVGLSIKKEMTAGDVYALKIVSGVLNVFYENGIQNSFLSSTFLLPSFHIWELPTKICFIGNINSDNYKVVNSKSVIRALKQSITFPVLDVDPYTIVKTVIGEGHIDKLSINLSSLSTKIDLSYEIK